MAKKQTATNFKNSKNGLNQTWLYDVATASWEISVKCGRKSRWKLSPEQFIKLSPAAIGSIGSFLMTSMLSLLSALSTSSLATSRTGEMDGSVKKRCVFSGVEAEFSASSESKKTTFWLAWNTTTASKDCALTELVTTSSSCVFDVPAEGTTSECGCRWISLKHVSQFSFLIKDIRPAGRLDVCGDK